MNNTNTKLYCLIGDPVTHSLSPAMHNAAFAALGINALYTTIQVKKEKLKQTIYSLQALGIKGINVTIPHKITVMKYLDYVDNNAKNICAVNTIVNKNGKLIGYNTDIIGAITAIKSKIKNLKNKTAIVIGAGGTSRAVCFGLAKEGARIIILNRTKKKAEKEARLLRKTLKIDVQAYGLNEKNLSLFLQKADLLCNCTPIGLNKEKSLMKKELLRKGLVIFDAVYKVGGTKLIRDARTAGCIAIGGEQMLVNQGAAAFELFVGKKPDTEIMLNVIKKKLNIPCLQAGNIYLIGFMGSGKSSVGRLLAKKLKMNFIDLDNEIEKITGKSIKQIFAEDGEEEFREVEIDALTLASKKGNCVIAVGGGAILNYLNTYRMRKSGKVVLLRAPPEVIVKRLEKEKTRPLLLGLSTTQRLARTKKLLRSREPFYNLAKNFEVQTNNKSTEQATDEIIEVLGVAK